MKVALCDDEGVQVATFLQLIDEYRTPDGMRISVDVYHNAFDLLEGIKKKEYEALLLDIIMPGFNGLEIAKEIRNDNIDIPIVFLTNSPEFAVESYKVRAFDYIIKPVPKAVFFDTLDRIFVQYRFTGSNHITIKTTKGIQTIPAEQIVCVEISNRIISFQLLDGSTMQIRGKLSDYEEKLLSFPGFLKVHRSYIVKYANSLYKLIQSHCLYLHSCWDI